MRPQWRQNIRQRQAAGGLSLKFSLNSALSAKTLNFETESPDLSVDFPTQILFSWEVIAWIFHRCLNSSDYYSPSTAQSRSTTNGRSTRQVWQLIAILLPSSLPVIALLHCQSLIYCAKILSSEDRSIYLVGVEPQRYRRKMTWKGKIGVNGADMLVDDPGNQVMG